MHHAGFFVVVPGLSSCGFQTGGPSSPVRNGILVPPPGIKLASSALQDGFLTTGPLGKAQHFILKLLPWFPYPQPAPSSQKLKETAAHSSILAWEIPLDRGAWQATVHGVAKSCTRLSDGAHVRTLQPRTSAEFFD